MTEIPFNLSTNARGDMRAASEVPKRQTLFTELVYNDELGIDGQVYVVGSVGSTFE